MPTNEPVLLLGAEVEFHALFAHLAEQSFARAERFDRLVHQAMLQLAQFPRSAQTHAGRYRRLLIDDFPYALFYAVENERVFVHAILDVRQSPSAIRLRLGLPPP